MNVPRRASLRARPDLSGTPSAYRARKDYRRSSTAALFFQRLTAAALGLCFAALLVSLGLLSVTSRRAAQPIIARALPTLLQTNALLGIHGADLRAAAASTTTRQMRLPGFPLDAGWSPGEIQTDSNQTLASLIDSRAASQIYQRGPAAFGAGGGQSAAITGPFLSGPWMLRGLLSLLNARTHARLTTVSLLTAAPVLAFLLLFCLQVAGYGRLLGSGLSAGLGALVAVVGTLFLWLVVQLYYGGASSPVALAAWGMAADGLWVMVLLDAVALITCAGLSAAGVLFAALERRAVRQRPLPLSFQQVARRRPLE
jgi:hypothetical protein